MAPQDRKIIYTGSVDLVVRSVTETDKKLRDLVKQADGFVSNYREDRTYGDQLSARWVVRVPAADFGQFLEKVEQLGVPELKQIDAQDVTEEFVDLEARLRNQRRLEERMLSLLDERAGDIKDVVEVESQLGRVREEIERMEGRLRYLTDHVTLSTVTIDAREERDYVPKQAPGFSEQIAATFSNSLHVMLVAGKNLVLVVVAAAPWLLLLLICLTPLAVILRRRLR